MINAGTGIGVAIVGPIALLTHEHWRAAWVVFAIIGALVTVWAVIAVPLREVHRSAVWTFGREVLTASGGMSESGSSNAWVFLGAFGAAAGDLIGRFGIRVSWMTTMLVLGAATTLLPLCPGTLAVAWSASAFRVIALGQAAGAPVVGALPEAASPLTAFLATSATAVLGAFVRPAKPQP